MYRVMFSEKKTKYTDQVPTEEWVQLAAVEGDHAVVAGALRAMANKLDPPDKHHR